MEEPKPNPNVDAIKLKCLNKHIESLCHSGSRILKSDELKKVIDICEEGSDYIAETFNTIFKFLDKKHAEVRYSCTQLSHELFMRYEQFQDLMTNSLRQFLILTIGMDSPDSLPPPRLIARRLKKIALKCLYEWHIKYSDLYPVLGNAVLYLDKAEHIDFNTCEVVHPDERKARRDKELALNRIKKAVQDKFKSEMEEMLPEIRCNMTSLNSCFELLFPSNDIDEDFQEKEFDYDENRRLHGIINPSHSLSLEVKLSDKIPIKVSDENSAILDAAKDSYVLIYNRFLPKVKAWLQVFKKADDDERVTIEICMTLKNDLDLLIRKYHRLDIIKEKQNDKKEKDDFLDDCGDDNDIDNQKKVDEEVSTDSELEEVHEPKPVKNKKHHFDEVNLFSVRSLAKNIKNEKEYLINKSIPDSEPKPGPSGINTNERKRRLLEVAPKLPYDVDLYHWDDDNLKAPTMVVNTNAEGARFWGGASDDIDEIPVHDGIASLRTRVIEFSGQWEPVDHTCRAPLTNGKLCPRQDRVKCPFHGLIVERDDKGSIVNKADEDKVAKTVKKPEVPDWQDPKLLAELKAQTGFDLKLPEKGKKKKKRKKYPGLTDLKAQEDTPFNRLSKKIFNKKSVKRVAESLDKIDHKKHLDKFGDQFNYNHNK